MSDLPPASKENSYPFNDSGSLDACRDCSGAKCCGNIKVGGTIEPPFLTSHDVIRIGKRTGLGPDKFSDETVNPATGKTVRFLKINSTEGCHFLKAGRCSIHEFRPVDCRLFPLDLKMVNGAPQWVIYNYHHCDLSERDHKLLMEQIASATMILGYEMLDYATVPTPGMAEMGFKLVSPSQSE
jgi:hypothetical protein